jgi:transcriptional regulator with XRE-family HTH domain
MDIARTGLTAEDIGVRLRAVRELSGLSVGEVSKASGVPRRDINAAEHGRRVLDAAAMRAVAGALGVQPGVLVSSMPQPAPDEPEDSAYRIPVNPAARREPERPLPIAYDLPAAERRIDDDTRADLEQSWVAVRSEMHEVLDAATRLAMCGNTDDATVLMRNVVTEIDKLQRKRSFQQAVARHQAELLEARATGPGTDSTN